MTILAQQQVATFPVWDGELELWQPEGATYRESRDNDGPGPTGPLVRYDIPPETTPWTEEMVQELWNGMLQEGSVKMDLFSCEIQGWEDLDELLAGQNVDIYLPSYFNEWDQSLGLSTLIRDVQGKAQKFTPEMLVQRDNLNEMFNFQYGSVLLVGLVRGTAWINDTDLISDKTELLELTAVGENHGVAKSDYGAVFIPRGALKYLFNNGGVQVGTIFDGEISFTPGNKFPWRLNRDGVKYTYQEQESSGDDDY